MTNKRYVAGRNFEYQMIEIFKKGGYSTYRTAGSHSAIDVICMNETELILIQCKKQNKKTSYKADIEKLKAVQAPNALKLFAVKQQGIVTLQNVDTGSIVTKKLKELNEWRV